jgi:hypothetical protein
MGHLLRHVAIMTAVALVMPAAALARVGSDRVAEDDSVVSTTSTSYVDLGGPSLTVSIARAGTPVNIWFYAQTMQTQPNPGQASWFELLDNGSKMGESFYDHTNDGWGLGLWAGPNQPSTGAQNITVSWERSRLRVVSTPITCCGVSAKPATPSAGAIARSMCG